MFIRSLAGQLLLPVLATLLVLTTPIGTGHGIHENDLLHPVLQHVHLVNGQVYTDGQLAARAAQMQETATSAPLGGTALGAASGADAPGLGVGVGPSLPMLEYVIDARSHVRFTFVEDVLPTEFRDSPQDPPPDFLA